MAEAWRYDSLITTATTDILLNVASTLIIVVPVWGPLLSAGFQVIQIVREGDQYRVAFLTAEDSKASAFTFGQTRVISDQDCAAAERGEFVFAAVSGSFDIAQTLATPTAAGTKADHQADRPRGLMSSGRRQSTCPLRRRRRLAVLRRRQPRAARLTGEQRPSSTSREPELTP